MTTLTASPNTLQASLMEALSGEQPERALEQAFLQLSRGGDLPLLLAMVKALVRTGVAGLALRLLRSAGGLLTAEPQLASLADRLASLAPGEVSAEVLERRFGDNLKALLPSRPHLRSIIDAESIVNKTHCVFISAKGNVHVVRENPTGKLDFVFPFADQLAHVQALKLPETALGSSFLMVGVPNPALWRRLLAMRTTSGYVPPIDIVEPDADVFALWLSLIEEADALRDERIAVFAGADAPEQYRKFVTDHPWRGTAMHCMTNFRPRWQPPALDKRFHESINAAIAQRTARLKDDLDARCADRDAGYWHRRFEAVSSKSGPLRIAGFTTRFSSVIQHSMRDLAKAFERCGCQFQIVKQPNQYCAAVDVIGALSANDFDLIVVIDHLRSEFAGVMPANIPYVCWIQDHMEQLLKKEAGRSVGELDLVVGHSPHVMASLYGYPLDRFLASNNLTDAHTYDDDPLPVSDLERYRCDVSYVSHGAGTPEQLIDEIAAGSIPQFRQYLLQFLELAHSRLDENGWINSQELVELMLQAELQSNHPPLSADMRRTRVYPQLARLYDRLFRHQALQWSAQWAESRNRRFKIFGKGWRDHPSLGRFAAGEIESGHPLRCVYQASTISLQVNGYSSLHQRLLDGLAAGAFMLCRHNPADFVRQPFLTIQQSIREWRIQSLDALVALRKVDPELRAACEMAERLTNICIAPSSDPKKQVYNKTLREGNAIEELCTDDALMETLAQMRLIPQRVAADLPGFEQTTFRNERELHSLLDQFIDDPDARRALSGPMRKSVIAHDTYDGLVGRILNAFANRSALEATS